MFEVPEIKLLKGLCTLDFGASIQDVKKVLGEPQEIQNLSDDILNTSSIAYHYWDDGYSLFFDVLNNKKFNSVELDHKETLLFNTKLFSLNEKELVQLMKSNGYALSETENHPWGEKRLSFDEAGLDCYFQNNKIASVNFGIIENFEQSGFFAN